MKILEISAGISKILFFYLFNISFSKTFFPSRMKKKNFVQKLDKFIAL